MSNEQALQRRPDAAASARERGLAVPPAAARPEPEPLDEESLDAVLREAPL